MTTRKTYKRPYQRKGDECSKHQKTVSDISTFRQHGKTISVEELPECDHKTKLLNFAKPKAKICVIAVRRGITNKWVVYAGFPSLKETTFKLQDHANPFYWLCENVYSASQVLMLGNVLDVNAACTLFPEWDKRFYTPL